MSRKKPSIPRSYEPKLDALARTVRNRAHRRLKQNRYNRLNIVPRIEFLALTETESYDDEIKGTSGAITAAHAKLTYPETSVYCELRVGTETGTGIAYVIKGSPTINGVRQLEPIVNSAVKDAVRVAMEDYYARLGKSTNVLDETMCRLKPVETQPPSIHKFVRGNHNVKTLHDIIKKCSHILSNNDTVVNNEVRIRIIDTQRRYVNSEGTVIKDSFYGIHIKFSLVFQDSKGMHWPMYDNFYFTNPQREINVEKMENRARRFMDLAMERVDCDFAAPYYGPVLLEPEIFSSELHEALVHLLASDAVLDENSTTLGVQSFNNPVAPEALSIYSDPKMNFGNEWGFYLYDQEGVIPERVALIEDGVHVGFLADRHGAQVLSEILGVDIPAGSSLTDVSNTEDGFTVFKPQPRINVLDVKWGDGVRYTKKMLKKRFIGLLKEHGLKEGLYVTTAGCPGYCSDKGEAHAEYFAPYMMDLKGRLRPVKPMESANASRHILKNIVAVGSRKEYRPHRCGDGEYMAVVRAAIATGPGIIDNMNVIPIQHKRHGRLFGRDVKAPKAFNRHW
jgi:hypothetical protein